MKKIIIGIVVLIILVGGFLFTKSDNEPVNINKQNLNIEESQDKNYEEEKTDIVNKDLKEKNQIQPISTSDLEGYWRCNGTKCIDELITFNKNNYFRSYTDKGVITNNCKWSLLNNEVDIYCKDTGIKENFNNPTIKDGTLILGEDKYHKLEKLEDYRGFSFSTDDPSIIHPFTKTLAIKKNDINEEDALILKEDLHAIENIELYYKDNNQTIIKLDWTCPIYECLKLSSYYIYVNDYSNLITVFISNIIYQPEDLLDIFPNYFDEIRPTMPILKSPQEPEGKVDDGYYFASVEILDPIKKQLGIDFLSLKEEQPDTSIEIDFDIFASLLSVYSTAGNKELENKNVNIMNFYVDNESADGIPWEEHANYSHYWKGSKWLIGIKENTIVDMRPVIFNY